MNLTIKNKLTVGLTGGILCGKSSALAVWQKAGAYTISCDELVKQISARPAVQKQIQAALGITERGALTRKVFTNSSARKKLEQILHPLVRVVEVPLLFEAGWEKYFDLTVALVAPTQLLASRTKQRGLTQTDLLRRSKAQWPQTKKAACADICIVNDGTENDLMKKISALHRALCAIYKVK